MNILCFWSPRKKLIRWFQNFKQLCNYYYPLLLPSLILLSDTTRLVRNHKSITTNLDIYVEQIGESQTRHRGLDSAQQNQTACYEGSIAACWNRVCDCWAVRNFVDDRVYPAKCVAWYLRWKSERQLTLLRGESGTGKPDVSAAENYSQGINANRVALARNIVKRVTLRLRALTLAGLSPVGNEFPAVDCRLCHGES